MEALIAWSGFVGGWLLFAGPVYQAANELSDAEFDESEFRSTIADVPRPVPVSPWWWLLPPVAYWRSHRRSQTHRAAIFGALSERQREEALSYLATARGWLIVATGAFLIATKETWELCEHYEWPESVFFALVAAAALLGLLNTAASMARAGRLRRNREAADAAAS